MICFVQFKIDINILSVNLRKSLRCVTSLDNFAELHPFVLFIDKKKVVIRAMILYDYLVDESKNKHAKVVVKYPDGSEEEIEMN
jgi:hypothetical protein